MNRQRELELLLSDSGARVLVCLQGVRIALSTGGAAVAVLVLVLVPTVLLFFPALGIAGAAAPAALAALLA